MSVHRETAMETEVWYDGQFAARFSLDPEREV